MLNTVRELFAGFQASRPTTLASSDLDLQLVPVDVDQPTQDPRVAFEIQEDSSTIRVLYPSRIRDYRLEPEARLVVLLYRDFNRAVRQVELHGQLRAQFGSGFPLWTVDIDKRDDDLVADAVVDARALLHALRNPVECPIPHEDFAPHPPASSVHRSPEGQPSSAVDASTVPAVSGKPTGIWEGVFKVGGYLPYPLPDGKRGKPSYAILLTTIDGREERVWGSDLARVVRQFDLTPGDRIRLLKYPATRVPVGERIVLKNMWDVVKLESVGA